MKQTILAHKIELILSTIVLIIVLFISLMPVEYRTTAPGYNHDVGTFITIENAYPSQGTFHTTSVISLNRTTLLQKWIGEWEDRVDVREQPQYYQNIDISDLRVSGALSKNDSLAKSLVVGISRSAYAIEYDTYLMVYLTYNILDPDTLVLGDIVLSVNDNTDVLAEINAVDCNDTAEFRIVRDDDEQTFTITKHEQDNGTCMFGLLIREFTDVNSSEINYTLHETLTTGSSGGLMQALYILNQLSPNDLTGGLMIAGTGTIAPDGTVGRIGGIRQKIITSAMNGVDVFFVPSLTDSPSDNYQEALAVLDTLETDMVLVPVQTMDDAISYLESRFGGAYDE